MINQRVATDTNQCKEEQKKPPRETSQKPPIENLSQEEIEKTRRVLEKQAGKKNLTSFRENKLGVSLNFDKL